MGFFIYCWTRQHICIPILPKSLIPYVCAPMPFVLGVLSRNLLVPVFQVPGFPGSSDDYS